MCYDVGMKEDRAERRERKRAARAAKQKERIERHVVVCPHCGKNVLDHMTECPHCKGALQPAGYRPVDPAKYKKIKLICTVVGIAVAVAVVIVIFVTR